MSKVKYLVGGIISYITGVALFMKLTAKDEKLPTILPSELQRQRTFDNISKGYDSEVSNHEFFLGINSRRKRIIQQAEGDVLELGVGTGRNFAYYNPSTCRSVTAIDFSYEMLKFAREKLEKDHSSSAVLRYFPSSPNTLSLSSLSPTLRAFATAQSQSQPISSTVSTIYLSPASPIFNTSPPKEEKNQKIIFNFEQADARCLPFSDNSFDTVVETFSICSYEEPIESLKEIQRVVKPNGKVLLLEHGQSTWGWLVKFMEKNLMGHVVKFGCYWNRDIEHLVRESGLYIDECKRSQFGTLYYIIASKPNCEKLEE